MENNVKPYKCDICDKYYKSKNSLGNHNRIFHPKKCRKSSQKTRKSSFNTQNNSFNTQKTSKNTDNSRLKCRYCSKIYSRSDNLKRHMKNCKEKKNIENENLLLKKENEELKNKYKEYGEEIKNLKEQLLSIMNKQCKMHHQTFNKIQNQLNICKASNYSNCTFNIVQLGQEDLVNTLSDKEQLKVLNKKYNSLNFLIDYIHCNEKFPEFNNVIITNLQNNIAYIYDHEKNRFIAKKKDDLIDDIIYYRMSDLEEFYDIHLDNLDDKTKEVINDVISKMEDNDKFINKKKEEIKLILYNNKNDTIDGINLIK